MSNPKDYVPRPIDTSSVQNVDQDILELLAKNTHEVWAKQRMEDGWTYGEHKDEVRKTTPLLIPYEKLSDEEKQYDRNTAEQALKVMMAAGIPLELSPEARENLKGMFLSGKEKAEWERDKQTREMAKQKNEQYYQILKKARAPYVIAAFYSDPDAKRHGDNYHQYTFQECLGSADTLEEGLLKLRETAEHWQNLPEEWDENKEYQSQLFFLTRRNQYGGYANLANEFCSVGRHDGFSVDPITFPYGIPGELRDRVAVFREAHPELFAMTALEQKSYDIDVTWAREHQKEQNQMLQNSGQRFGIFEEDDSRLMTYHLWPEEKKPLITQEFRASAGDLHSALQALYQFGTGGTLPQEFSEEHKKWNLCMIQNDPETGEPVLATVAHLDRQGVKTENQIWRDTASGIQWNENKNLLTPAEQSQIAGIRSAHPEWFAPRTARTPVRQNPEREEQVRQEQDRKPEEDRENSRHVEDDEIPF